MFKKYDQKQQFLLPISLEDFIKEDHISRILNDIIDAIDITIFERFAVFVQAILIQSRTFFPR